MQFQFENYTLDLDRRELRRDSDPLRIEPQVFDLMAYLVQNRTRVVTKDDLIDAVWRGRVVSESTVTSRINAARRALDDSGKEQRLIRTASRKGIRFVGDVLELASAKRNGVAPESDIAAPSDEPHQEIRFCTASDGTRIAYAEVGAGPPLLKTANWMNHLDYDWHSPAWNHLWRALAAERRLIRYDQRGNGLSDWDTPDISPEAFVRDLESVVQATGLERFPLFGISQGCAISIAYAARYPERVSHLVLYSGFARGMRKVGIQKSLDQLEALTTLMRLGWGRRNAAFRQIFTSQFVPGGTLEQIQAFNDLQRETASPENAVRILHAIADIDVLDLLPQLKVPTLVLHCRGDALVPFEEGRRLAAAIPNARFVALEGSNHVILEHDPGRERFLAEVRSFLAS